MEKKIHESFYSGDMILISTGIMFPELQTANKGMKTGNRENIDNMNSDQKVLRAKIESSLKSLGIPSLLYEERKLPIFQDASELVVIEYNQRGRPHYLIPQAGNAWNALRDAANGDGVVIEIVSAYRSFQQQFEIVKSKIEKGMSPEVVFSVNAPPGCSEHHTGCAVDIGTPNCIPLDQSFDKTAAFSWLQSNAMQFGFELSYPPSNLFGFDYEPWHWCYQKSLA